MVRILLVVLAKLVVFVSEQPRSCADVLGTFLVLGVTLCTSAFLPGSSGVRLSLKACASPLILMTAHACH